MDLVPIKYCCTTVLVRVVAILCRHVCGRPDIFVRADRQAGGAGVFYDSWRRKTHPHVWILNTPVVIWYIADKIWCATRSR